MKKLAILGAGSWGMTLAWLYAGNPKSDGDSGPREVWLWDRTPEKIKTYQSNPVIAFPVSLTLPDRLNLTDSLAEAADSADAVILAVTSHGTREVARKLAETGVLSSDTVLINASKGIEYPSLKRLSAVLAEETPRNPFAALSGPTLAAEILAGKPTACSIASENPELAEYLQVHLSRENLFRLYSNTDVTGVELAGSLKNIFAIASGYMQARKLGDNARAALITRGLAEMTRISVALGADEQTLYGLSGLGDLLATCNSPLSRNYQVGFRLGQGETLSEILANLKVVAEGVQTTHAVCRLAERHGLDAPIVQVVEVALGGQLSEEMIIRSLMSRKLKSESVSHL